MKKVAIVTGGGRGIGASTAKMLAKHGYDVCVNYNNSEDNALEVVQSIKESGGHAIAVKADISSEADIIRLFETVDRELGPVTALVNNAGISGGSRKVAELDSKFLELVFSTNVYGIFYTCREALKRMKQQGHGSIVNVSSEAARFGGNNMAHYAASKAAVNTFTIAFAREAGESNVKVNTVSPGIIDTDMYRDVSPERIETLKNSVPFKRLGKADEVADTILWLLSDKSSYVNGSIIPISGGR